VERFYIYVCRCTGAMIVWRCMLHISGTVFAYGQTSSGKTYTMRGTDDGTGAGIIPLCIKQVYKEIEAVCNSHLLSN